MIDSRKLSAAIRTEIGVRVSVRRIRGIVTIYRAKGDLGCFSREEAVKIERLCQRHWLVAWGGAFYCDRPECERAHLSFIPVR